MACSFDHFLLRFQMSVAVVGHQIGNMPMQVLNLGEKRCELLFTNGKSYLVRNVIDQIIYHQCSNNDLKRRLQPMLQE